MTRLRTAMTPVVLVALATVAVAYAYGIDRDKVSDVDRAARRRDIFPSFRVEDVRRIELDHGAEKLVLERVDEGPNASSWSMTSPRSERADAAAVDALLRELELATWVRRVAGGDSLGLDSPRATGRIAVGPLEYGIALGADAPKPDGAAYLKVEGEGTYVVGRSLTVQLLRAADAYRERALVPSAGGEIEALEVKESGGGGFALERHGATFRTRDGVRASRPTVERLLSTLADARAAHFLDDAAGDEVRRAPVVTVVVGMRAAESSRVELAFGGACAGHADEVAVLRTSPSRLAACVPKGVLEGLRAATSGGVRDASAFFARMDEVEELRLESVGGGGPAVDLARKGMTWHERAPEDRELSPEEADSANALVGHVVEARGAEARVPGAFVPVSRVSLVRTGGRTREVVELSAPEADGDVLVRRGDDGAVLRVPAAIARHMLPRAVALRARPIWRSPFDPAAVTGIDDDCGPAPQRLVLRSGSWTLLAPRGYAADAVTATDLASAVARAKADAWVADSDDPAFGFHGPGACTVAVTLSSPTGEAVRRAALTFGVPGEGGVYARMVDDPAVLVAPMALYELATHPAIDRSAFRSDPAEVTAVVLDRTGARASFSRRGSDLVREGAWPGDAAADDAVARTLASLYALAALHPGPPRREEGIDRPTLEVRWTTAARGETRVTIGGPARFDSMEGYFARVRGIDATFVVPKAPVEGLLEAAVTEPRPSP